MAVYKCVERDVKNAYLIKYLVHQKTWKLVNLF